MRGMTRLHVSVVMILCVVVAGFVIAQEGGGDFSGFDVPIDAINDIMQGASNEQSIGFYSSYGDFEGAWRELTSEQKKQVVESMSDEEGMDKLNGELNEKEKEEVSEIFRSDPSNPKYGSFLSSAFEKPVDVSNIPKGAHLLYKQGNGVDSATAMVYDVNGDEAFQIPVSELSKAKNIGFTADTGNPYVEMNNDAKVEIPSGANDVSIDKNSLSFTHGALGKITLNPAQGDTISHSLLNDKLSFSFNSADSTITNGLFGTFVGQHEGYTLDPNAPHSITYNELGSSIVTENGINIFENGNEFGGKGSSRFGEGSGGDGSITVDGNRLIVQANSVDSKNGMYFKAGDQNYQWGPNPNDVVAKGSSMIFDKESVHTQRSPPGASQQSPIQDIGSQFNPDDRQVNVPRVASPGTCGPGGNCGAGGQPEGTCGPGGCGGSGGDGQASAGGGGGSGGSGEQGQGSQLEQLAQAFQQFASQLGQAGGQQGGEDSGSPGAPPGGLGSYDGSALSQVAEICAAYGEGGDLEEEVNPVPGLCGGSRFEATDIGGSGLEQGLA